MRAEIVVSVGTELLLGQITDTNAVYAAKAFSAVGIGVYRRVTVGDNMERLVAALRQALSESDIVLTIGGLGPTMDDITREGLADAFGDTLHRDDNVAQKLRDFFALRKHPPDARPDGKQSAGRLWFPRMAAPSTTPTARLPACTSRATGDDGRQGRVRPARPAQRVHPPAGKPRPAPSPRQDRQCRHDPLACPARGGHGRKRD